MATHDYNLANQSGASFRSDLNDALQAVLTNNSSASSPSTTAAYMLWADTNTGILKIRNSANDAWVELLQLDGTLTLEDGSVSAVALGFRDELNTGIFSSGSSNFDVAIAGTTRLNISATGLNITGTVTDDGATHDGDVTFTGASANVVFDKSDNALEFADNAIASFGAGADLTISHNGSNSIINDAGTGELQLQRGGSTVIALSSTGADITGAITGTGDMTIDTNTLHVDSTNNRVGIGTTSPDNLLHLYESNTTQTADSSSQLVLEKNSDSGITILSGNTTNGRILFGDSGDNDIGQIDYDHNNNSLQFVVNASTAMTIDSSQNMNVFGSMSITGGEGTSAFLNLISDDGDDNADHWLIYNYFSGNTLVFANKTSGSFVNQATLSTSGDLVTTGSVKSENGNASGPGLGFSGDTDTGFYLPQASHMVVTLGGNGIYRFRTDRFSPEVDNQDDLGGSSNRWDDVRATNGTINTSDRNEKNTITATDLGLDFVNKLTPVSYKFNTGKNGEAGTRTHYGLIAQDIETVLGTISKSATDFAGFCKDEVDDDGNAMTAKYGLRYSEFIAPMVKAIQELSAKVTALEGS